MTYLNFDNTSFQFRGQSQPSLQASAGRAPMPRPRRTSSVSRAEIEIQRYRLEAVRALEEREELFDPSRLDAAQPVMSWIGDAKRAYGQSVEADSRELLASGGGGSGISGWDAINLLVRNIIIRSFRSVRDTTEGWVERTSLPDYKAAEFHMVTSPVEMQAIGRGQTAASISFGVSASQNSRLTKFASSFTIDEQDVPGLTVGAFQLSLAEVGAACKRTNLDLVYSLLLSNPELPDAVTLFHASRGNLGTGGGSALGTTGLATAYGAIANQTLTPTRPGGVVHIGLTPRYLIVPPGLGITGRGLANAIRLDDDSDLVVRTESRLGASGVIDPVNDDVLTGTTTNWLLAATSEQAPSIMLHALDGNFEPRIRSGQLKGGEFGQWFDVALSIGACAVDGRGLHFNTGA